MRHLRGLASIEVALLAGRVVGAALVGPLIPAARGPARLASPEGGAPARAVAMAVVAPAAEEEHLPAPRAGHKPERVHARYPAIFYTASRRTLMARGKNKAPTKTFQQRQTERREAEKRDRAIVEDMAAKYTCSNSIAHDFAGQCEERLEDLDFDLLCSKMALDFWADPPEAATPVVDLLRELETERRRYRDALTSLRERLRELTKSEPAHHHLPLPIEHYQQQVRERLFGDPDPTAGP
jgi:hypothetical protein